LLQTQFKKGLEVGTDEAGRGCLAGPVVSAAVILPENFKEPLIRDSKKLTEKKRVILEKIIKEKALAYSISICSPKEIDQINILNASIKAMHLSISKLKIKPTHILVDGNRFHKYKGIPHKCVIKGDDKFMNIAAASILAKTFRDNFMKMISKEFPVYRWDKNKGYPTKEHRDLIKKNGPCVHHRKSFKMIGNKSNLDL
jgi:ribonuclease HII|tara:strand:+ start:1728 stop:2324 length:597 start_codon:yes stop_codon:yes gene_type:complete